MTLNGRKIDVFFHPTAVRPGSVLETGDRFCVSGGCRSHVAGLGDVYESRRPAERRCHFPVVQIKWGTITIRPTTSSSPSRGCTP